MPKTIETCQPWQVDPANVKTEKVQVWSPYGTMLTAQMSLENARNMVVEGRAFVISDQAVGQLNAEVN